MLGRSGWSLTESYRALALSYPLALWLLRLPAALPFLFPALRVGVAAGLVGAMVAELLAFAESWGTARRKLLEEVISEMLVLPIGRPEIYAQWAKLKSYAKDNGLAIQQDHNDIWIAATAKAAGLTVISSDAAAFLPLRDRGLLAVEVIDPKTGQRLR